MASVITPTPTPSHWGIITAGDVQAEQSRTLASAQATDQAVQACTTIDAPTKAQWATFLASLTTWCNTPIVNVWTPWTPSNAVVVSGDTGDTMMAWEAQLSAWQQKIAGACANTPPSISQFNPSPPGAEAPAWEKWAVVGVGFLSTAAIVAYVTRLIPSASQRETRKKPPPPPPPAKKNP